MCNPRRVRVDATRQIAEAWKREVRRRATLTGRAVHDARVREPLGDTVGGPALAVLPGVLADAPGWSESGDSYRHELPGGYVVYHAESRELEIVATASADVVASAEAARTVAGEVTESITRTGEAVYYDDYGTEEAANRTARARAERAVDAASQQLAVRARQAAERAAATAGDAAANAMQAEADRRAADALGEAIASREADLAGEAAARLTAVGVHGRNLLHQILLEAYQRAILAYARAHRADHVVCTDTDGVLEIEFELDV